MGGFLLVKKEQSTQLEEVEETFKDSLEVFEKKGLALAGTIVRERFVLFHYSKYSGRQESIYELGHEDFMMSCGTLIYKGQTGSAALKSLHEDFCRECIIQRELCGHYAVVMALRNRVYGFNDYLGLYRMYVDVRSQVLSSSFLAVSRALKKKTISVQEFYEYLFYGAFFGGNTLFKEIRLLGSEYVWEVFPDIKKLTKKKEPASGMEFEDKKDFSQMIVRTQIEYFAMLKDLFGDNITAGLSGGYDTRLMLALMRKVGLSPKLYVYGRDQSTDVEIAKAIAKGEHFTIAHINKGHSDKVPIDVFYDILAKNFYAFDGMGNYGIFDNGSDLDARICRTRASDVQLNGIGGEIYRNNGKLPDQEMTVRQFIRSKYRLMEFPQGPEWLDREDFYLNLEGKLKAALSLDSETLSRPQIEMHYPFFVYKYWTSINCSINQQFSQALTPFTEARFIYPSFNIPIKHKDYGAFHCGLIKLIDPNLLQYPFTNGLDRLAEMPVAKDKHIDELFLRAYHSIKMAKKEKQPSPEPSLPYFMQENYLSQIFESIERLSINDFVMVGNIHDPNVLSRALSLECLMKDHVP